MKRFLAAGCLAVAFCCLAAGLVWYAVAWPLMWAAHRLDPTTPEPGRFKDLLPHDGD